MNCWVPADSRFVVFLFWAEKNWTADISFTSCCFSQTPAACGRTTRRKRGKMMMKRTKGSQASCFLISSHRTNTVLVSRQCLLCYSCRLSTDPACFLLIRGFRLLSFHMPVCSCSADDDYYEDDEEDDPDALKDPIYQIDLQVHSAFKLFSSSVSI